MSIVEADDVSSIEIYALLHRGLKWQFGLINTLRPMYGQAPECIDALDKRFDLKFIEINGKVYFPEEITHEVYQAAAVAKGTDISYKGVRCIGFEAPMTQSKTKTSFYRRLYVAYLIDQGIKD